MDVVIGDRELDWFLSRARADSTPWLPAGADSADADPAKVGGLYDDALTLWDHFRSERPRGVNGAKITNRENGALAALRLRIRSHTQPRVTRLAALTDLRLLDTLTWS